MSWAGLRFLMISVLVVMFYVLSLRHPSRNLAVHAGLFSALTWGIGSVGFPTERADKAWNTVAAILAAAAVGFSPP